MKNLSRYRRVCVELVKNKYVQVYQIKKPKMRFFGILALFFCILLQSQVRASDYAERIQEDIEVVEPRTRGAAGAAKRFLGKLMGFSIFICLSVLPVIMGEAQMDDETREHNFYALDSLRGQDDSWESLLVSLDREKYIADAAASDSEALSLIDELTMKELGLDEYLSGDDRSPTSMGMVLHENHLGEEELKDYVDFIADSYSILYDDWFDGLKSKMRLVRERLSYPSEMMLENKKLKRLEEKIEHNFQKREAFLRGTVETSESISEAKKMALKEWSRLQDEWNIEVRRALELFLTEDILRDYIDKEKLMVHDAVFALLRTAGKFDGMTLNDLRNVATTGRLEHVRFKKTFAGFIKTIQADDVEAIDAILSGADSENPWMKAIQRMWYFLAHTAVEFGPEKALHVMELVHKNPIIAATLVTNLLNKDLVMQALQSKAPIKDRFRGIVPIEIYNLLDKSDLRSVINKPNRTVIDQH